MAASPKSNDGTVLTSPKPRATNSRPTRPTHVRRPAPLVGAHIMAPTPAPTPAPTSDYAPYVAEIQRLQAMLTAQAHSPYPDAQFGMPVPSHPATVFSASRPREFYCWLHGWNNTHHGSTCKIMGSNTYSVHPRHEDCDWTGKHRRQPKSRCTGTLPPSFFF